MLVSFIINLTNIESVYSLRGTHLGAGDLLVSKTDILTFIGIIDLYIFIKEKCLNKNKIKKIGGINFSVSDSSFFLSLYTVQYRHPMDEYYTY